MGALLCDGAEGGADFCLPVTDHSILPGQGHSTGWDQLLAHCAKDGFTGRACLEHIHSGSRITWVQEVQTLLVIWTRTTTAWNWL